MSNRPKDFKRMPIFHITGFNHSTGKVIIESYDERLPNDEYYQRLIRPIHTKRKGRMKAKMIFNYLRLLFCHNRIFRY